MEKISIITNKYPNEVDRNVLVFVQQLVWTMRDQGVNCEVICPVPVNLNPKYLTFPYKTTETTENGMSVDVYFPKYIGFGQRYISKYNTARMTTNTFTKAVDRVLNKMEVKPTALYGHFITPAGITASRLGKKYNIPSFLAYGESTPKTIRHFGEEETREELRHITGVVSVSTHNQNELNSMNMVDKNIIEVFPNGYREERFFPRNKEKSRQKFGLPTDKFIIAFVGSYDSRKGIDRLIEAIAPLEDVYLIAAGKGPIDISTNSKVLFSGTVNNKDLPFFLSAADIFVLPTLNEGLSNAIIEALACGLPIVSSDLAFNDDVLDHSNSIRVDTLNIQEIREAIIKLKENKKYRDLLSQGSLEKAKDFTLKQRANNIIKFINNKVKNFRKKNT